MSFSFVCYPLLLLVLACLYFVPGRGHFIAAKLELLITAMRVLLTVFYIVATAVRITIARLITALDVVATAVSTTIARPFLCATKSIAFMTIITSITFIVRYAASLDYQATIAVCLIMAVVPRIRNRAVIAVLSAVIDVLDFSICVGTSISLAAFVLRMLFQTPYCEPCSYLP